ncbi:hypothetical protein AGMMS49574_25580 [Bacteroidia bacterium]|nr:hypothetical protein AGMMS49574_25580 [Bacteroidia bacterium]
MQILNKVQIEQCMMKHAITRNVLQLWIDTVESVEWKNHIVGSHAEYDKINSETI